MRSINTATTGRTENQRKEMSLRLQLVHVPRACGWERSNETNGGVSHGR